MIGSGVGAGASASDVEAVELVCGVEQAVRAVSARRRAEQRRSISRIEQLNCLIAEVVATLQPNAAVLGSTQLGQPSKVPMHKPVNHQLGNKSTNILVSWVMVQIALSAKGSLCHRLPVTEAFLLTINQ